MKVLQIPSRASVMALVGCVFFAVSATHAFAQQRTISQVAASGVNGITNLVGNSVTIQVTFSGPVWVSNGVPYIELRLTNSGQAVTGAAWFVSGSDGDNLLDFNYTVPAGHLTTKLNYYTVDSLILTNCGSPGFDTYIGNEELINKTLPALGGGNDLGNSNRRINGLAPIRAMATNAAGTYTVGANIRIGLVFPDTVYVDNAGGTPTLTLATAGVANRTASWTNTTAGTGSATQFFDYVVQAGDYGNLLNYVSADSLSLNGAIITNKNEFSVTGDNVKLPLASSADSLSSANIKVSAPVVMNVTSTNENGTYPSAFNIPSYPRDNASNITIFVQFSEPVSISVGTPTLTLATAGFTNQNAIWATAAGSTQSMRFNYKIQAGDHALDLDYLTTNSLNGSIFGIGSIPADVILPVPGAAGSLSANKEIIIQTPPKIANVTSTNLNGGYGVGAQIPIQVTFSKAVTNKEVATLRLDVGPDVSSNVYAYCPAGVFGTNLTFTYTVGPGHFTTNLSYTLTSGSITGQIYDVSMFEYCMISNSLPVPGAYRSLSYNKELVIDTLGPVATNRVPGNLPNASALNVVSNQVLHLWFSENVVTGGVGGTINIRYESNSNLFEAIDIASTNLVLTNGNEVILYHTNCFSDTATIKYFVEITNTLREARTYVYGVTNYLNWTNPTNWHFSSIDMYPPFVTNVTSETLDGFYPAGSNIDIQVQLSELVMVDTNAGAPYLLLGVTDSGGVGTARFVAFTNDSVLVFQYTVQQGDLRENIDYVTNTSLVGNGVKIWDLSGSNAVLTLPDVGAEGSLSSNKNISLDTIAPVVTNVTSTNANGYYPAASVINVQVGFSEIITNSGSPRLTLNTTPARQAVFIDMMAETNGLVFEYVVVAGDNSPRLDYSTANALTLNGAVICDRAGNVADLTLFQPGAPGSLGTNRNIIIDTRNPIPTVGSGPFVTSTNGRPTNVSPIPFTVTFNESVSNYWPGNMPLRMTVGNGAGANYSGSGNNYAFNATPAAQGGVTVTVLNAAAQDAAGNWNDASAPFVRIYDTVSPTVNMTCFDADPTTNSPITVNVIFSEYVTNFTALSVRLTNAVLASLVTNDTVTQYGLSVGTNFTCLIQPTAQGLVRMNIDAGAASDIAGNPCLATFPISRIYNYPAPSGLVASDGTYTDRVRLYWTGISGAFNFQVIRSFTNDAVFGDVVATVATTNYDDTSAFPGTLYYYWVRPVSAGGGYGPYSNPDTGWRNLSPPSGVVASSGTYTNHIHVTWNASEGATGYRVYRNTVNSSASAVQIGITPNVFYYDYTAGVGSMYYWLKATNGLGISDFSASALGWRVSFADALNNTLLAWETGGNAKWFGQTIVSHDGLHSAQSGHITDDQTSWMRSIVDIKGTLSFWWTVSCETNYDFVRFYIDGVEQAKLTGELTQWQHFSTQIVSGVHTLEWAYIKDQSRRVGQDAAWVDEVSFIELPRNLIASDGAYADRVRIAWSGSFTEETSYQVFRGATANPVSAVLLGTVNNRTWFDDLTSVRGRINYYWVRAQNVYGMSSASGPDEGHTRGVKYDFDADGRADMTIYHRATDRWYSITPSAHIIGWNTPGVSTNPASAILTPADYDGDGRTDVGVYQPESGAWFAKSLASGAVLLSGELWGGGDAIPLPADYDGDGRADLAVFFPSMGTWYIRTYSGAIHVVQWGTAFMTPFSADFEGDGRADLGLFDPDQAKWYAMSLSGQVLVWGLHWGWPGAVLVPADYDGDNRCDFGVRDAATGRWYILSSTGAIIAWDYGWGWPGSIAVPADYTGDGKADLAIYQPADGMWYIWAWPGYIHEMQWGWYEAIPACIGE